MARYFLEKLARMPLIAILRGSGPERALEVAGACWDAEVELVEIALSEQGSRTAGSRVCERAGARRDRGARAACSSVRAVTDPSTE